MKARAVLASALVAGALVAGCHTATPGKPSPSSEAPTTPPTSRPSTTTPSKPSAPISPPAAQVLPPDDSGYVFIETKSGQTRCQIDEKSVGCEAPFTNTPLKDGVRANGVNLSADGSVEWIVGNIGDIPAVPIDYRIYSAVGWTIDATEAGTRFTNQRTGHGMFVSIEKVDTF
jgi:hypothetical protein